MKYNVCWDITSKCNDKCKFCYRNKIKKDLSLEENKKILENLYNSNIINKITICGGEPLIYDKLFELLESIKKPKDIKLSLVTNGIKLATYNNKTKKFIINEELINKLITNFDWICFSLDASNQKVENRISRNNLHVARIKAILDYLESINKDINVKINSIVSKQNYKEIPKLYNFISNYTFIKRWKLFQYLGTNNKDAINKYFEIDATNFENVKNFIKNIKNANIKININDVDTYDGTYIMIKQDGTVEVESHGILKEVLDLKIDNFNKIEQVKEFNKEKHFKTHGVNL